MQTAIAPMTVKDRITKHWDSFGSHCIRKRKAAKVTRRSAKTRARKAIYEQYKDQGVYNNYPNCEYLLQQQYMSEEEDI
ncbi:hypothetical protein G6F57_019692 [Rhizopus arrhizus]|nr:hypothetical protein G6F28_014169 [Rhizopus arrhizus]KAG1009633.1 hypothetical protein G6F26_013633 [Rhizopus arrhizus]KAG1014631.1 hypothetical protein G6F25_014299 [Rhizopus arrhizus]KAG1079778.1 hypothetical protein G6F39_014225 [Rhizopus arrhizus]KAG1244309.1 hypothetical protein G6F65_021881 [Rhizopus arrhizus]